MNTEDTAASVGILRGRGNIYASGNRDGVTLDALTRFAALIRAQALEEGAQEFDRRDARNPGVGFYEPQEPAEILRALKDKPGRAAASLA